ncbi:MAG TPA: hypothetical protein H9933_05325 [Candidatus Alistipes merdavium]|nr:hypothetical protein [Candidatus Alistipes merdavium]
MKRIFAIPFLLVGMLLLTVSCNEELQIATYDQEAPSIASFTPTTGPVGTLVTVRGAGLHRIEKAYINDAEVEIRYAISGNEIVLRTTTAGSTGPISLESPDGTARSTEIFTYTYPTPEITTYPESFTVGDEVVFFGTGLDGILNVRFDTVEGEIVDQRSTELVVKVPDLRIPEADITFSYFDGSSVVSFVHSGAEIVREVPRVDQLSPSGTVTVGEDIVATGGFLHLVEQIKVGDVEARIVSQPENGQSLTFRILDDPSFPDGVNTLPLVFYSFNGSEVLDVQEQFSFLVPKFYTWRNANLNAHSVQKLNHFFCLDTGETYPADDFAEKVDPLTMSLGGGVCVAKNVLSPEVTAEQYYAVKPYIFFAYLGSGCYFYGAANNNNRLSNFKTSSGSALLTSGQAYGTPIILYRTLCEAEPAEKALIDKIKGGNFTNDDFSADLLDGIDLESKGSDTPDGWSNVPNGEFGAYKAPSESNHRPWAPALTSATETVDMNPGTVVLVMYFQPNWEEGFSVDKANIRKFGFIEITRLVQDKSVESGRQNNATFNVYWQRTPMGD